MNKIEISDNGDVLGNPATENYRHATLNELLTVILKTNEIIDWIADQEKKKDKIKLLIDKSHYESGTKRTS